VRRLKNVLNCASILLSNRSQLFFTIVQWIFELLNGDLLPQFVSDCLSEVHLQTDVVGLHTPSQNPAGYPKFSNLKDYDLENMMPIHQQL